MPNASGRLARPRRASPGFTSAALIAPGLSTSSNIDGASPAFTRTPSAKASPFRSPAAIALAPTPIDCAGSATIVCPTFRPSAAALLAVFGSPGTALVATSALTYTSPGCAADPVSVTVCVAPFAIGPTVQASRCRSAAAESVHGLVVNVIGVPANSSVRSAAPLGLGPALPTVTTQLTGAPLAAGAGVAVMPFSVRSARASAFTFSTKTSATLPPRPSAAVTVTL